MGIQTMTDIDLPPDLTLIIADAPPFRGIRQRIQQLAIRFAGLISENGGRVIYIDEPGNIVTIFLSPEKPLSNLWSWTVGAKLDPDHGIHHFIPPAGLPFGYHSKGFNNWNHFWYRAVMGNTAVGTSGPIVLIACNVLGLGWLGRLDEDMVIYDCADEISEFRQAAMNRDAVLKLERELIQKSDALVTTSQNLFDTKSGHAKRSELIRNAAEVGHFRKALDNPLIPVDLKSMKRPIVGYFGYLADWLDWELIGKTVRDGTEFDWVFIGPCTRNLSDLEGLDNFHALGRKQYEELPNYLAHFSCAHIPFALTPLTHHVNPVKLYEYLAGGVPVVATPIPELEFFSDMVLLASDPSDYLEKIREAVSCDSREKRLLRSDKVRDETWDARASSYLKLISDLI